MPRFYTSMTWEDWPSGGSWAETLEADNRADAIDKAKKAMAQSRAENDGSEVGEERDAAAAEYYSTYADDWFVVDCFDMDELLDAEAARSLEKLRKMIGDPPKKRAADNSPSMG